MFVAKFFAINIKYYYLQYTVTFVLIGIFYVPWKHKKPTFFYLHQCRGF